MKTLIFALLLLSLNSQASLKDQPNSIQYQASKQSYFLTTNKISGHELFSFFGLQSGLEIRFSPSLSQERYTLPTTMSEQELLRWLGKNLSTVHGFNEKKELISLTILPKGESQSETLIFANDPAIEGKAHRLGQTNTTAKQRFQLRISEFSQTQRQQLNRQIEKNFERENKAIAREQERLNKKRQKQEVLVTQLRSLRAVDPELYARILAVNKKRYPDLEAKVLQQ